ncbi:RNA polymerase sigma factor [Pedobacter sp. SAFR-022]|uniref:RNA polymerase sigma factor n=1 Tax=Pedobacter sp. SAFR-022 TaxID=3436861 RepID=UPI003F80BEC6
MEAVYIDKHVSLINECRQGSRQAQFEIYKLYAKAMFNIALRILNHHGEAEDVLQESFLDAFMRVKEFRAETTFGLWLKQIVINKSITCLRKRKMDLVPVDEIDIAEPVEDDHQDLQLQVDLVKKAIALLPDGYRLVLTLYLFEGYDHEEIAHILNISENTSRTQYMRAKQRLHRLLEKKGEKDEQRN